MQKKLTDIDFEQFITSPRQLVSMRPLKDYQKDQEDSILSFRDHHYNTRQKKTNIGQWVKINQMVVAFKNKLIRYSSSMNKHQQIKKGMEYLFSENYLQNLDNSESHIQYQILHLKAIDPSNYFLFFWDIIKTLLVLCIFALLPLQRSFKYLFISNTFIQVGYIAFQLFDFLLKINTAYLEEGMVVLSRIKIFKKYISTDAIFDIFMIIAVMMEELMIIILILLNLNHCLDKLQKSIMLDLMGKEITNLIKLTIQITCYLHLIACLWYYIGEYSSYLGKTWILDKDIQDQDIIIKYSYAYYWATISMVTIGYGDITPQNHIEIMFCIVVSLIASGIFAYTINQIGQILQSINKPKQQLEQILSNYNRQTLRQVNQYMKIYHIPQQLQNQIANYLEYQAKQAINQESENLKIIFSQLSHQLQLELHYHVFKSITSKCDILNSNFEEKSLKNMASKIQQIQLCPGEIIFKQNDYEDNSIYFIASGSIQLLDQKSTRILQTLTNGQYFGEIELFTSFQRSCTASSNDFTKVYKIQRQDFIQALTKIDLEVFHEIKEKLLTKQPVKGFHCFTCNHNDHFIKDCPLLQYKPDIERVILKENWSSNQRIPFNRRPKQKQRNLHKHIKVNQKTIFEFVQASQSEISNITQSFTSQEKEQSIFISVPRPHQDQVTFHNNSINLLQRDNNCYSPTFPNSSAVDLQQELIIDKYQVFSHYFPHNNINNNIRAYNRIRHYLNKKMPNNQYHFIRWKNIRTGRRKSRTHLIFEGSI